jgi:hypothetical protein
LMIGWLEVSYWFGDETKDDRLGLFRGDDANDNDNGVTSWYDNVDAVIVIVMSSSSGFLIENQSWISKSCTRELRRIIFTPFLVLRKISPIIQCTWRIYWNIPHASSVLVGR